MHRDAIFLSFICHKSIQISYNSIQNATAFVVVVAVHFQNFPQSRSQLRVPLFLDNDVVDHFGLGPIGPAGTAFHAKIMKMFILF